MQVLYQLSYGPLFRLVFWKLVLQTACWPRLSME
jgi:hypothetical protein